MNLYKLLLISVTLFISAVLVSGCKSTKKVTATTETPPREEVKEEPELVEEMVEEVEKTPEEKSFEEKLLGYFEDIASSPNVNLANRNISEVLSYFESGEAPVFVVFYREGGQKDYDKPTTIAKYLNYLKDQKKNPHKIDKIIYNDDGKIEEIELTTR
jgi:hypothetical protein